MAWARIDDKFFLHPKVVVLDADAKLLYLAGLTYCAGGLTDGLIPEAALGLLGSMAGIANAQASAVRLLKTCLWANAENGYVVHDYLEYNPSREKVTLVQNARKQAGSKGGQASRGKPKQAPPVANAQANAQANEQQTPSTSPSHPHITSLTEKGEVVASPAPAQRSRQRRYESAKAERIARVAEAFKASGGKFPKLTDQDAKALGSLLDAGYSPETLAECWRDFRAKLYRPHDGFAGGQLSFQFLSGFNRVGNWQDWVEQGRPEDEPRASPTGRPPDPRDSITAPLPRFDELGLPEA